MRRFGTLVVGALVVGALAIAGCGSATPAQSTASSNGQAGKASIIRFCFAPDPVWDYLTDTGTLAQWEIDNNIKIVTSSTWDEFTYFAGGHGDIVSMGTPEIPMLEAETGIKTVTFGKYNYSRVAFMRRAGDPYVTLEDVPKGSKIAVSSPISNTGTWGVVAQQLYGLDYRVGGGDFNLVVNDHFVNPVNLLRGDVKVAAIIPEAAVSHLRDGSIELMYQGEAPAITYGRVLGLPEGEKALMGNLFIATAEWYDSHQREAKAFLELWQKGIDLWQANKAEIIQAYPQHFAIESQADIDWLIKFMEKPENDWFVDSVYMDQAWIDAELRLYDFMTKLPSDNPNHLDPGYAVPRFEALSP